MEDVTVVTRLGEQPQAGAAAANQRASVWRQYQRRPGPVNTARRLLGSVVCEFLFRNVHPGKNASGGKVWVLSTKTSTVYGLRDIILELRDLWPEQFRLVGLTGRGKMNATMVTLSTAISRVLTDDPQGPCWDRLIKRTKKAKARKVQLGSKTAAAFRAWLYDAGVVDALVESIAEVLANAVVRGRSIEKSLRWAAPYLPETVRRAWVRELNTRIVREQVERVL